MSHFANHPYTGLHSCQQKRGAVERFLGQDKQTPAGDKLVQDLMCVVPGYGQTRGTSFYAPGAAEAVDFANRVVEAMVQSGAFSQKDFDVQFHSVKDQARNDTDRRTGAIIVHKQTFTDEEIQKYHAFVAELEQHKDRHPDIMRFATDTWAAREEAVPVPVRRR